MERLSRYNESNVKKIFSNINARLLKGGICAKFGNIVVNVICSAYYLYRDIYLTIGFKFRKNKQKSIKARGTKSELTDDLLLREFKKSIENKIVVSFDVFDTLLVRPFCLPEDLFLYIERETKTCSFREGRIKAENFARQQNREAEEITLDQIYKKIHPKYKLLKEDELAAERELVRAYSLGRLLYNEAEKEEKKILFISDTYLSKDFVRSLLNKCGYKKFDSLYVSSEIGVTKASGNLFDRVLEVERIDKSEVVHTGDNKISDFLIPKKKGISSFLIPSQINYFYEQKINSTWDLFKELPVDLTLSIHKTLIVNQNKKSFFYRLGYALAAPLVIQYLKFAIQEAKLVGADLLIFVARDGWILKRVYERYSKFLSKTSFDSAYIYLNRIVGIKALLEWCDEPRYLRILLELASKDIKNIKPSIFHEKNVELFNKNIIELKKWSENARNELYSHVLERAPQNLKSVIIDTTTGAFSSLRFAKTILKDQLIEGIFTGTYLNKEAEFFYTTFFSEIFTTIDTPNIKLMEFMITSPEPPVEGLSNGKPVYGEKEEEKAKIYKEVEEGIFGYIEDHVNLFRNLNNVNFSPECLMKMFNNFRRSITDEDKLCFESIIFSSEPNHKKNQETLMSIFD